MSSDISLPKPSTSLSKTSSRELSTPTTLKRTPLNSFSEILPQEEPPEPAPFASCTPLISPEPDLPPMLVQEALDNSTDSLIAFPKLPNLMESKDFTKDSESLLLESLLTEPVTLEDMTQEKPSSGLMKKKLPFGRNSFSPKSSPLFPVLHHTLLTPSEEE